MVHDDDEKSLNLLWFYFIIAIEFALISSYTSCKLFMFAMNKWPAGRGWNKYHWLWCGSSKPARKAFGYSNPTVYECCLLTTFSQGLNKCAISPDNSLWLVLPGMWAEKAGGVIVHIAWDIWANTANVLAGGIVCIPPCSYVNAIIRGMIYAVPRASPWSVNFALQSLAKN